MSRQPEDAESYPEHMMLDHEREIEEARGWRLPGKLTDEQLRILAEARTRRAREDAAAGAASERYYLTTACGRLAAERLETREGPAHALTRGMRRKTS
jgi:hypothetical protein